MVNKDAMEIPASLREETRYLGRVLGQVLRDQAGIKGYDRIERIRQAAVGFRRAEPAAAHEVRAFSYFLHLLSTPG